MRACDRIAATVVGAWYLPLAAECRDRNVSGPPGAFRLADRPRQEPLTSGAPSLQAFQGSWPRSTRARSAAQRPNAAGTRAQPRHARRHPANRGTPARGPVLIRLLACCVLLSALAAAFAAAFATAPYWIPGIVSAWWPP